MSRTSSVEATPAWRRERCRLAGSAVKPSRARILPDDLLALGVAELAQALLEREQLQLALARLVEVLRRPDDEVDDRAQERDHHRQGDRQGDERPGDSMRRWASR